MPARIVILRHGEKPAGKGNPFQLSAIGVRRSRALVAEYLGHGAKRSLFRAGEAPAVFFTITLHTLETASPSAESWGLPVIDFSAVPLPGLSVAAQVKVYNARTQQAAAEVMTNPAWRGKTVVMVWEHKRIASDELEKQFPSEKITLRQLLNLDRLGTAVPAKWEGQNFDYFWDVTYGHSGSPIPTGFRVIKQKFAKPFSTLPHNDWGMPAAPAARKPKRKAKSRKP